MQQAQIRVLVSDASDPASVQDAARMLTDALAPSNGDSIDAPSIPSRSATPTKMFFIRNKIDNLGGNSSSIGTGAVTGEITNNVQQFDVSCVTGDGIPSFESALTQAALNLLQPTDSVDGVSDATESAVITRDRHRSHVKRCVRHLDEFIEAGLPMDAAAEELRYVLFIASNIYNLISLHTYVLY